MSITLKKSKRPNKKYVVDTGDKKIYFGDSNYRDFLLINDEKSKYYEPSKTERENIKSRYRRRHRNDNLESPLSAGALSYYLLWSETSLRKSIKNYEKKFNIKIIVK